MKKTLSRHQSGALPPECRPTFFALICALGLLAQHAGGVDINNDITKSIWKMNYGVTDAQIADSGWLSADSDGDGIENSSEIAAGTNPFQAGSVVKITTITATATQVSVTFPTVYKKQYLVQGSPTLSDFANIAGATWTSTTVPADNPKTLTVNKGANKFFRVLVQDIDTDGDGVADWAEIVAGFDPNNTNTDGSTVADGTALADAITTSNVVTVSVVKSSATQPKDAGTAPIETGAIKISRSGPLRFNTITVPLQKSGSALEGTDYDSLPNSVTFLPPTSSTTGGQSEIVLTVNPKYNVGRMTNVTAIVQALAGGGYSLGALSSGAVVLNPAGLTTGTGLTGQYHNQAVTPYSSAQTVFAGTPEMTRTDQTIDFNGIASISLGTSCTVTMMAPHGLVAGDSVTITGVTGGTFSPAINGTFTVSATGLTASAFQVSSNCTAIPTSLLTASVSGPNGPNGWGELGGPDGMSPASANTNFSVRWTGRVLPQYSETYFFDFRSDDSAKVWVNGRLLIDRWQSQSSAEFVNSINLKAGILYDIQIDYLNLGGNAEARLYWWSISQPKQIIPQSRLFPASALASKDTAVTSSLVAVGYEGVPFTFNVQATSIGGAVTFAVAPTSNPLPPGLSLNGSTGEITGTPTLAGTYNVAIDATNTAAAAIKGSSVIDFTIHPTGSVTRETLVGTAITANGTIPVLDDDTDYGNNISRRLRGYMVPPKTGNYYFWLAANNTAELWISNDSESVNRVLRASVTASTGKKVWNASPTQQSKWISLVAGQRYYFDVLHNTGTDADDYVNVGWCQDDVGTRMATSADPNPTGAVTLIPNGGGALQGYPFSGSVPGYLCQPYDYPALVPAGGALYSANLGPQGTATTQASGSANLRLAAGASPTSATLYFNYQNLSGPKTAYHLHVDAFDVHGQGEIIFDIDDVDAFHPELITADGGYIWNFETGGTFSTIQQIRDAITLGKVYLNVHTANNPAGEIRGTLTLVEGSQTPPDASLYPEPSATDDASTISGAPAARFLNQATFGASPTDINYVKANGFSAWIEDQLTKPASHTSNDVVAGITADINNPYPSTLFTDTWWKYSITGQDQLRQRLAFALSEILVVSWQNDTSGPLQRNGRILADYYDQLIDYCLPTAGLANSGTFRGVLKAVTLTPAMGLYLDMRANEKGDISIGRIPNENYAREIIQLFSVGLNRTWDDGKFVLDSDAAIVPSYTQPTIIGLANLFTGWNYAQANQANGRAPTNFGPGADYLNPMVLVPSRHELDAKLLLNNVVAPPATGRTPRVFITGIATGNPCTITTSTAHGLTSGDTVAIAGVSSGAFTGSYSAINATFQATVASATTFTVPIDCTTAAGVSGTVTGPTVTPAAFTTTGITPVTGSQSDSNGTTLPHPYDQYGLNELDAAIDNIVASDNVPPYICRQLIQRLVTSDPSPGYVYRVVQKFKNNGSGVRGDLAAVVRQILLDGEARRTTAAYQAGSTFGKQREPMLRLTGPARAFPASGYTGTYTQLTGTSSNKLRVTTTPSHDFSPSFTVSLDFHGNNSPTGQTILPVGNPTSTAYVVQNTTAIAATHLEIPTITPNGGTTIITTATPHGLTGTKTVWFFGLSGKFSDASINSGGKTATSTGSTTFTVPITTTNVFQIQSISVASPCVVTTVAPHGLSTTVDTTGVTINGVNGGTYSGGATSTSNINGTTYTVRGTGANTFTVKSSGGAAVNCTVAPTSYTTWRESSNPVVVTTQVPHGLNVSDSVTISGVSGGSFTPTINGTFTVATVLDSTSFSVASSAASPSTVNTGSVTSVNGGPVLEVNATGMVNATYSQTAGNSAITVSTQGPQTDVPGPSGTIKSKVYLMFLSQTNAGGGSLPTSGVYDVQTVNGTTSFTVTSADTLARSGQVLMPKIPTSYTPLSGNLVQFNNNVNHNLVETNHVWVDVPVVGNPLADGEFTITTVVDEDHFKTANKPDGYSAAAAPSGSNNSVNIYPLVAPPTGRSGVVAINQSSFTIGTTETTLTQSPLNSPTVFNYFFPDYKYPGALSNANLDSPEFQLTTDTNVMNLTNSLTNVFIGTGGGNGNLNGLSSFNNGGGSVVLDIGAYMLSAKTADAQIPALIDELANLLIGAPLEAATKTAIQSFVTGRKITGISAGNPCTITSANHMLNAGDSVTISGVTGGSFSPTINGTFTVLATGLTANAFKVSSNCTSTSGLNLSAAYAPLNFPYTTPTPTNQQMRDRVRAIIHLIITSAEYAVQK